MDSPEAENKKTLSRAYLKVLLPYFMAFLVPFVVAFALLVNHEKEQSHEEIQRTHVVVGQETFQPDDDEKAWKGAIAASIMFATPIGLIGLGSFACFRVGKKLLGRKKDL